MTFQPAVQPRYSSEAGVDAARNAAVWLMFVSSFFVLREPAPCDVIIIASLVFFALPGMRLSIAVIPLLSFLFLYNLAAFISYMMTTRSTEALYFVVSSIYMGLSAVFFSSYIFEDSHKRFENIKSGYVIGATIAALIGLAVYFDIGGFANVMAKFAHAELYQTQRATGAHKDPNVYSTYLVMPCVMLLQGFLNGTNKRPVYSAVCFMLIFMALFLAFSRGAWINVVMSTVLLVGFTYVVTPSSAMRRRILIYSAVGLLIVAVVLAILLSVPAIQSLFLDRFTLTKSYDVAETGRFGNQMNSIPKLLGLPFGFGPYQFGHIYGLAPHNTFLNAFASGGWLGGITFITFSVCNIAVGLKTVFTRSPFQNMAILTFSCLVSVLFQGIQIDMEHWRHFYWMIGLLWGLFAATLAYEAGRRESSDNDAAGA